MLTNGVDASLISLNTAKNDNNPLSFEEYTIL